MQPREKLLAAVVGGMLLLLAAYALLGRVSRSFSQRNNSIALLKDEIRKKQALENRGKEAATRLADWEHRSLPSNVKLAGTLYQNWLRSVADKVKLANINIDTAQGSPHGKKIYHRLPFGMQCRGTLTQAIAFMHEFYSANHLHQIRAMSIKPRDNGSELDLNFTIEALVLPGADRADRLNDERSTRLVAQSLDDYNTVIVKRNLFAQYSPPAKPPVRSEPPKPKGFDAAKFAILTGITEGEDGPIAWISVKTSGEAFRLHEGDPIQVGEFTGKIGRIGLADVEIESDGKLRLLMLGKSLAQAVELAAEPPEAIEAPAKSTAEEPEKAAVEAPAKPVEPAKPETVPDTAD